MYIPSFLYEAKCAQQLSYGFNILDKLKFPARKFKILWGHEFFKKLFKSNRFQVVVWTQNVRFSDFSFGLILKRI